MHPATSAHDIDASAKANNLFIIAG